MSEDQTFVLAQKEAQVQSATAEEWLGLLRNFVVQSDEQQEQIAGVLRDVKTRYKLIEDKRTEITKPLNQALRAVNDLFRPPKQRFEELEALLKGKITAYLDAKHRANEERLRQVAAAQTPAMAQLGLATVSPVAPPTGVTVRKVWKYEITDPDLVPREYCSPDPKKIAAADPSTAEIPGVRFFQEQVVSARSG